MSGGVDRVLAAVDGSVRAAAVLSAAMDIAEAMGATVHVLRVVSIPPEFPAAAASRKGGDALPSILERDALGSLRELLEREPRARSSQLLVRQGARPWRTILEVAEETDSDLIVLGSHGYDNLDRILGTTAGKVANMAMRNVLVVHNRKVRAPDQPTTPYRSVPSSSRTGRSRQRG